MSVASKRNLSGIICLVCAVFMMFCIARMIPYGLVGEVDKVKFYFVLMIISFVFGLASDLAYDYYRGKVDESGLERMRAEVAILSRAGRKSSRTKRA
jgi:hypothetical protein